MSSHDSEARDEARIRAVVDARLAALRSKDARGALASLTTDVATFDLPPPLRTDGDAARDADALAEWLDTWAAPPQVSVSDLRIEADGDVAFAHGLLHMLGPRKDGTTTDLWARTTLGLRREGGDWRIAHEHTSVPFYMDGSLRAAVDLKPSGGSQRGSRS